MFQFSEVLPLKTHELLLLLKTDERLLPLKTEEARHQQLVALVKSRDQI